mmetsp:Transcript_25878/g.43122  ORF Transcript_25878/g.43122 Transcript_25878/m.43122 type:complete len:84 (+) Transcript_25878:873-1124(+)
MTTTCNCNCKSMPNSWQNEVNRREFSPMKTEKRSPSEKQIFTIGMSSKDTVDVVIAHEAAQDCDELLEPLEIVLSRAPKIPPR